MVWDLDRVVAVVGPGFRMDPGFIAPARGGPP